MTTLPALRIMVGPDLATKRVFTPGGEDISACFRSLTVLINTRDLTFATCEVYVCTSEPTAEERVAQHIDKITERELRAVRDGFKEINPL